MFKKTANTLVILVVLIISLTACASSFNNTNLDDNSTEPKDDDGSVTEAIEPANGKEDNTFNYPTHDMDTLLKGFFLAYYNGVLEDEKYNFFYEKNEDTYLIIKHSEYAYSLYEISKDVQNVDVDVSITESEELSNDKVKLRVYVSVEGIKGFGGSEFYTLLERDSDLYKIISIDEISSTYETLKGNVISYMEEHSISYYESVDIWTSNEEQASD